MDKAIPRQMTDGKVNSLLAKRNVFIHTPPPTTTTIKNHFYHLISYVMNTSAIVLLQQYQKLEVPTLFGNQTEKRYVWITRKQKKNKKTKFKPNKTVNEQYKAMVWWYKKITKHTELTSGSLVAERNIFAYSLLYFVVVSVWKT